uniref:Uncharacterized protein n=1 Tax=Cannabis sativa TaxID=3483 RepID=A0A803QQB2_CANSA
MMELPKCPICLQNYDSDAILGYSVCLLKLPQRFHQTIRCPACTLLVWFPPQCPSVLLWSDEFYSEWKDWKPFWWMKERKEVGGKLIILILPKDNYHIDNNLIFLLCSSSITLTVDL